MCYLNSAPVAYHPLVLHAPVLATGTLPIFFRTKYSFAEKSISLRLISTVIYRFRLFHFSKRPAPNVMWTCKPNAYCRIFIHAIKCCFRRTHVLTLPSNRQYELRLKAIIQRKRRSVSGCETSSGLSPAFSLLHLQCVHSIHANDSQRHERLRNKIPTLACTIVI